METQINWSIRVACQTLDNEMQNQANWFIIAAAVGLSSANKPLDLRSTTESVKLDAIDNRLKWANLGIFKMLK